MNYWKECVESALEEAGLLATQEQVDIMANVVRGGHNNYDMAYPLPENPLIDEVKALEKKVAREKSKVTCANCNGSGGWTVPVGVSHQSYERCHRCNGEGRHDP